MKIQGIRVFNGLLIVVTLLTTAYYADTILVNQKISKSSRQENRYSTLVFKGSESILSSSWTKSVLFNSLGTKIYTFNLEEMSIYEFDSATRKISRKFRFKPTPSPGWNYQLNKAIPSFEEKPVEARFSNDDQILWVSLHNAGGIVAIPMDALNVKTAPKVNYPAKTIFIENVAEQSTDTIIAPFIKTGKTPKVIARTLNNKYLLVSNWHSGTISVIRTNDSLPPYGKKVRDIRTGTFPRGIAITNSDHKAYVANMGSDQISVLNTKSWKVEKKIPTNDNPRHIIADGRQRLYVSYNAPSEIACINTVNGKTLFKASTSAKPRTIALSKNNKFLFVACYEGNSVDVFRVNKNSFTKIYSIHCEGKPAGIDIREDAEKLEAWVCTYTGNSLQVLSFKKK